VREDHSVTQLTALKKFVEMVMLLGVENSEESERGGQYWLRSSGRSKARSDPKRELQGGRCG